MWYVRMTVRPDDDNQQELWIFVDHWVPEHGSPAYLSGVVNMQEINIMCLCITFCVRLIIQNIVSIITYWGCRDQSSTQQQQLHTQWLSLLLLTSSFVVVVCSETSWPRRGHRTCVNRWFRCMWLMSVPPRVLRHVQFLLADFSVTDPVHSFHSGWI